MKDFYDKLRNDIPDQDFKDYYKNETVVVNEECQVVKSNNLISERQINNMNKESEKVESLKRKREADKSKSKSKIKDKNF